MQDEVKMMTQMTPNPNALKFIVSSDVKRTGKISLSDPKACDYLPLAREILRTPAVVQVHLFENVITVTQDGSRDWSEVEEDVELVLMQTLPFHDPDFASPEEILRLNLPPELQKIEDILDSTVRSALQADGGDVEVVALDNHILTIRYQGACGDCPSSMAGTLSAIRSVLQEEFDPELEVVAL